MSTPQLGSPKHDQENTAITSNEPAATSSNLKRRASSEESVINKIVGWKKFKNVVTHPKYLPILQLRRVSFLEPPECQETIEPTRKSKVPSPEPSSSSDDSEIDEVRPPKKMQNPNTIPAHAPIHQLRRPLQNPLRSRNPRKLPIASECSPPTTATTTTTRKITSTTVTTKKVVDGKTIIEIISKETVVETTSEDGKAVGEEVDAKSAAARVHARDTSMQSTDEEDWTKSVRPVLKPKTRVRPS